MPLGPRGPPLRGPLESLGTHGTHMPVAVFYLSTSRRRLVISKSCHANALLARSLFWRNRSGYVRLAFRSNFGSIGGNRGNEFEVDHRQHRALNDDHHPPSIRSEIERSTARVQMRSHAAETTNVEQFRVTAASPISFAQFHVEQSIFAAASS